jgi:hypothetical protein
MAKQWFCVSCVSQIELDIHGRCSVCGSDAVERMAQGATLMIQQEHTPVRPVSHSRSYCTTLRKTIMKQAI